MTKRETLEKKKNNKAPPNQTKPNPVSERVLEPRCVRACVWPTSLRACVLRACKALKHLVGDFSLVVLKTTSWFAFAFGANDKFVLSRTPRVLALSPLALSPSRLLGCSAGSRAHHLPVPGRPRGGTTSSSSSTTVPRRRRASPSFPTA